MFLGCTLRRSAHKGDHPVKLHLANFRIPEHIRRCVEEFVEEDPDGSGYGREQQGCVDDLVEYRAVQRDDGKECQILVPKISDTYDITLL